MSAELDQILSTTHQYRKQLAEIERRHGSATQKTVDDPFKVDGQTREQLERMDDDLSAIEARARAKDLEARLARLEAEPQFSTRATKSAPAGSPESPEFAARWAKAMISNDAAELRVLAYNPASSPTSNPPVPVDMERRIVNKMYQASVIRQLANVQTINSQRQITVEASTPAAALVRESGAISPADFTFDRVTVMPYKYVAATTMSQEWVEDALGTGDVGTFLNWMADRFGVALARATEQAFTVGTGSDQPQGIGDTSSTAWASTNSGRIINQGVVLAEDAAASAITADNIINCIHAVPPQYRTGKFAILTHDNTLREIRKLKLNNEYIWLPGGANNNQAVTVGLPSTIYGVPVYVNEYVPTTQGATTTGADVRGNAFFIAGNWDYYGIFDRAGISSMVDPYSLSANLRTTMYMWLRTDAKILLPEAFAAIYGDNDGVA